MVDISSGERQIDSYNWIELKRCRATKNCAAQQSRHLFHLNVCATQDPPRAIISYYHLYAELGPSVRLYNIIYLPTASHDRPLGLWIDASAWLF